MRNEREDRNAAPVSTLRMSDKEFVRIADFIYAECGIKLPLTKKTLLEARIQKRLRVLDQQTFAEYIQYLFRPDVLSAELPNLIDVVTTNTTEFFRENKHFEILTQTILPAWMAARGAFTPLRVWSAGCSSGEEPYTLGMVLSDFALARNAFRFSILATDISTQVLEKAVRAIYPEERVAGIPMEMKKRYLMRSKDKTSRLVRIVPELRSLIEFKRLNFMEDFQFQKPMDIIFCRNVIIYFDRKTQEELLSKFCRVLVKDGHVFIGHSESLAGMNLPLRQVAPTVYRRV